MKKLFIFLILSLAILLSLTNVLAWSNNTFNNSLTSENISLTAFTSHLRWLNIPTSVNALTNVFLNLTGYGLYSKDDTEDSYSNNSLYDPLHPPGNAIDENNNTYTSNTDGTTTSIYENYTWNSSWDNNLLWYSLAEGSDTWAKNIKIFIYNYSSSSFKLMLERDSCGDFCGLETFEVLFSLDSLGISNKNIQILTNITDTNPAGGDVRYYEGWLNNSIYPSDVILSVGDIVTGTDYELPAGEFNTTNKTTNLANFVNQFLPTCDCSDCFLTASYCSLPFYFYSTTTSILNYNTLIFNNSGILENSQTYDSTSYPSTSETFILNFTYDTGFYTSVSGVLNYNGTNYAGTLSGSGTTRLLTTTITTPSSNTAITYPFYWNISMTNSTSTSYFKSNNYTQSISTLNMRICNSTPYNTTFINFSIFNSEATTNRLNASFKVSFYYGSNASTISYTHQDTSQTNSSFAFCFIPSSLNYTISASIEYEATGYSKNYYYLNDIVVSNATTNISLYLLNSTKATVTQLKVQNIYTQPQENVYITIQKYDAGTDTYYTIGMARTDFNGQDIVYLNWYDTFYKYSLSKNGVVVKITNQSKVDTTPILFKLEDTYVYTYDKFGDISYTLTFNNVTNNFIFTYSNPTGGISSYCLRVVKRTPKNDTQICNTCETSSSATIYCNVDSYGNGTYVAVIYGQGSLAGWDSLVAFIGTINEIYDLIGNVDGSIYAFFFSAIILVMFMISPVLMVVGAIFGMVASVAIGFQPIHYAEMFGIVIVGVVVIIILKK